MEREQLCVGTVVKMRKVHPCGTDRFRILRVGADIGAACCGCGRVVRMERIAFERAVREVVSDAGKA